MGERLIALLTQAAIRKDGGCQLSGRSKQDRLVHVLAVVTAVVSLAPIGLGSLVTTLGAGMAFPDWPTSDGQGMLAYPWLQSSGDKFVEHGHRLAGMLVGFCSIGLCAVAWLGGSSKGVRYAVVAVLLGVIVQGLLGGLRVRLDRQVVAFGHSVFGCLVFVSLWMVSSATSRSWPHAGERSINSKPLWLLAWAYPFLVMVQYVFGGVIRHLGSMLHAHLVGAGLVFLFGSCVVISSVRTGDRGVRRRAILVGLAVFGQVCLGLGVWLTKFGFAPAGLVAVQHSLSQVVARSLHTVVGMVVVATAVSWAVTVLRSEITPASESASGGLVTS
ncbi:MAG: COX15/CtaA family protein [Planctomycetales bacterium]|jgi:cytochrome c oxidase assembly protein subunit 15